MVFDFSKIGDYTARTEKKDGKARTVYFCGEKAFLVENSNTIEVRTDPGLSRVLRERYESVMESRYFGRGGIEIVLAGQLSEGEVGDLVRLSYDLTRGS